MAAELSDFENASFFTPEELDRRFDSLGDLYYAHAGENQAYIEETNQLLRNSMVKIIKATDPMEEVGILDDSVLEEQEQITELPVPTQAEEKLKQWDDEFARVDAAKNRRRLFDKYNLDLDTGAAELLRLARAKKIDPYDALEMSGEKIDSDRKNQRGRWFGDSLHAPLAHLGGRKNQGGLGYIDIYEQEAKDARAIAAFAHGQIGEADEVRGEYVVSPEQAEGIIPFWGRTGEPETDRKSAEAAVKNLPPVEEGKVRLFRGTAESQQTEEKGLQIHVKDDPKIYGEKQFELRQPSGAAIRGIPISPTDAKIPDEVYHVTTNASAVRSSGFLRASGAGGLGGDRSDQIVSFTIDKNTAIQLKKDFRLMAEVSRLDTTKEITDRLAEALESEGWGSSTLKRFKETTEMEHLQDRSAKEWLAEYFQPRWRADSHLKHPVVFSSVDEMKAIDPKNIDIISVPKSSLKTGALLTDFDLDSPGGLKEIRSHGDVPLDKSDRQLASVYEELSTPYEKRFLMSASDIDENLEKWNAAVKGDKRSFPTFDREWLSNALSTSTGIKTRSTDLHPDHMSEYQM